MHGICRVWQQHMITIVMQLHRASACWMIGTTILLLGIVSPANGQTADVAAARAPQLACIQPSAGVPSSNCSSAPGTAAHQSPRCHTSCTVPVGIWEMHCCVLTAATSFDPGELQSPLTLAFPAPALPFAAGH